MFNPSKYIYYNPELAFTRVADAQAYYAASDSNPAFLDDAFLTASNVDALAYLCHLGIRGFDVSGVNRAIGSAMLSNGIKQQELDSTAFFVPNVLKAARLVGSNVLEFLPDSSNQVSITPSNVTAGDVVRILVDRTASVASAAVTSIGSNALTLASPIVTNAATSADTVYTVYGIRAYDPQRLGDILFLRALAQDPSIYREGQEPLVSFGSFNSTLYTSLYPESTFVSERQAYLEALAYRRMLEGDDVTVRTSETVLLYNNLLVQSNAQLSNDVIVWGSLGIGTNAYAERLTVFSGNAALVASEPSSNDAYGSVGHLAFALQDRRVARLAGATRFDSNVGDGGALLYVDDGTGSSNETLAAAFGSSAAFFAGRVGLGTAEPRDSLHIESGNVLLRDSNAASVVFDGTWDIGVRGEDSNFRLRYARDSNATAALWRPDGTLVLRGPSNLVEPPSNHALLAYGAARFQDSLEVGSQFLAFDGDSVEAPGYAWTARSNTGMYLSGSNLSFAVDGVERLRMAGDQVVVEGNLSLGSNAAMRSAVFLVSSNDSAASPGFAWAADSSAGMFLADGSDVALSAGGAERLRVQGAQGHVGIGTTSATRRLHVHASDGDPSSILIQNGAASGEVGLAFHAPRMPEPSSTWVIGMRGSSCNLEFGIGSLASNFQQVSLLELTAAGKLGIGTIPEETLHTNGNMVTTGFAVFSSNVSIASKLFCSNDLVFGAYGNAFTVAYSCNALNLGNKFEIDVGASTVSIYDDLYVPKSVTTTNIHYLSDARLKKDIRETSAEEDLATLAAIPIKTFKYIDESAFGGGVHKGVIAQDLRPDLTTERTDVIPCIMSDATWLPEFKTIVFENVVDDAAIAIGDVLVARRKTADKETVQLRVSSSIRAQQEGGRVRTIATVALEGKSRAPAEKTNVFVVGKLGACLSVKYDALLMTAVNAIKALAAKVESLSSRDATC
jgi:hypothetical protein